MKDIDLTSDSSLEFARDMFLFSFYTRGMSFLDMAYLDRDAFRTACCHTAGARPARRFT